MTHFDYKVKEITDAEKEAKIIKLFEESDFTFGDTVRVKGIADSPMMSVTGIKLGIQNLVYGKVDRAYIDVICTWYSKGRQEFLSKQLSSLCLEKVKNESTIIQ